MISIPILMFAAVTGCHPVAGNRIVGSDLAAASPAFAAIAPEFVVGNAPQPGARRFIEPDELARIARTASIEGPKFDPVCFERVVEPLDPARVVEAIRKSLALPQAEVQLLDMSRFPAPRGELVFPREAVPQPSTGDSGIWNGYVDYPGGRFSIWANVQVRAPVRRLVAAADLKQGQLVAAGDVRVEDATEFPRRSAALDSAAAAIGQVTRRSIRAGSPLFAADLTQPNDIERGQTVVVEVRSGAAVLKLEATAMSAGRRGDLVALRNAASGKTFQARVEDPGRAVLELVPYESEIPQ